MTERTALERIAELARTAIAANAQATFTLSAPLDGFDQADARANRLAPDPSAPLPLGYPQVVERARQVRRFDAGATWAVVARVMGEYHGFWRGSSWWAREVKAVDPSTARPRGRVLRGSVGAR